jgi:hypothetical protein
MATKPIPVRLDPVTIARLDRVSKRLGTNRAALIRFCAETFVRDYERHGGIASLPPNWEDILRSLDSRRSPVIVIHKNPPKEKAAAYRSSGHRRDHSTRYKAGQDAQKNRTKLETPDDPEKA